jgi:pimeloyl-ACP methyl ester carboxylesterase
MLWERRSSSRARDADLLSVDSGDARNGGYSRCMKPSRSGYLPINGLQLYYEAHGELGASETVPLLLICGAFLSTESVEQWVAAFAAKRPVIVFDQQGHGRTADTPRTMSYEQFGDDAAALLHALEVERTDVMGYSQRCVTRSS